MSLDTNFFVTFPIEGTQTVTTGTLRIDYRLGKSILPNETIIPLVNRSTQLKPLQSIFFNIDKNINVEMSLNDKITYKGLIPAGHFTIKNVKYDLIIITTSESTEIAITGSYKTDCIVTELGGILSKTTDIELIEHQAVTHQGTVVGTAQNVSTISSITISLFHASIEDAANTNSGKFLVQISMSESGNADWGTIYEFDATISTADFEAMTAIEPIGETVLAVALTAGFAALDKLYIQDTGTLKNSEWALCQEILTDASINLIDGLTNAKDTSDIIRNDADIWTFVLDVSSIKRIRTLFVHEGSVGADCHIKGIMTTGKRT